MSKPIIEDNFSLPAFAVKIAITSSSTAAETTVAIDTVCTAMTRQEGSMQRLRVLLGRLLAEVKDRSLFEPQYAKFEDFKEAIGKKHRLSQATIAEALSVARQLPKLTLEQAEEIPMTNLALVARAAKTAEPQAIRGLLRNAANDSVGKFKERIESMGLIRHAHHKGVTIRIAGVSASVAKRWKAIAGDDPAGMFTELINHRGLARAA